MVSQPTKNHDDLRQIFNGGLLTDTKELRAEYRKRNAKISFKKVPHSEVDAQLERGWSAVRQLKTKTILQQTKRHQDQLEDDVWCLFYRMGYQTLNRRNFRLPYSRDDGSTDKKQIDVFAKDSETVLVVECKSNKERNRRSLQKDLAETQAFRGQVSRAINSYFSGGFRPKIVWLYVTRNIIWSDPDAERATAAGIKILTENELQYYEAYIDHIGPAGRYQVLAEFLSGQKIPELADVKVPAVKGTLGRFTYYSFVTTPRHLLKIGFINHLALNHPDGRPAYQRMINKGRLKKIAAFIEGGGYFPTNLLVNFTDRCRFDLLPTKNNPPENGKYGWLYLPSRYKSAWIIDGQHRLYGYSFADQRHLDNDLFVLAFEKMDTTTEADLFITINHEQKSVPKSILIALQADLKWGSANAIERLGAIASALVKRLNAEMTSPFFRKFAMEGVAPSDTQTLTFPEVVKGLERSRLLGRQITGTYVPGALSDETDDKTVIRASKVLNKYFEKLRNANPTRWEAGRDAFISTNPGVRAHLMLLAQMIHDVDARNSFDSASAPVEALLEKCEHYIEPILQFIRNASDESIAAKFARKFGEGGVKEYFFNLCELVSEAIPNFGSQEYREYLDQKNDSRLKDAHSDVIQLNRVMMDHVLDVLKAVYGVSRTRSGEDAFWENGIESSKIKENAYSKQQQEPVEKRLEKFAYLETLDLMKIVRQPNNWPHFKDVFDIPLQGDKGKAYNLDWMEEFNELRRIPAHSSSLRVYTEEDYKFLTWLKEQFYLRLDTKRRKIK